MTSQYCCGLASPVRQYPIFKTRVASFLPVLGRGNYTEPQELKKKKTLEKENDFFKIHLLSVAEATCGFSQKGVFR